MQVKHLKHVSKTKKKSTSDQVRKAPQTSKAPRKQVKQSVVTAHTIQDKL